METPKVQLNIFKVWDGFGNVGVVGVKETNDRVELSVGNHYFNSEAYYIPDWVASKGLHLETKTVEV